MVFKMVKKVLAYIFNKPLYYKYYKSLEPPTLVEQKLIEDLKKTFADLPHQETAHCPPSEKIWKQIVTLPLFPDMTEHDLDRIISVVRAFNKI